MYHKCRADHTELIVVEGKHAANAVDLARDRTYQSVLAMQGKVPNIARTGLQRHVERHPQIRLLIETLTSASASSPAQADCKFDRVMILSDPDMDGLHAAMLLLCLVAEVCPYVVQNGLMLFCRSPLYHIPANGAETERFAYSDSELQQIKKSIAAPKHVQRYKGLASIPADLLRKTCIDPISRRARVVSEKDSIALKNQLEQPFRKSWSDS